MATKLKPAQITALKAVGISGVSTEEEARDAMIAYLGKNDIDGVSEDSFEELLSMTETIYEGSEEEMDAAAEEVEKPKEEKKKKSPKDKKEPEPQPEPEEEEEEPSDDDMRNALIESGMKKKEAKNLEGKKLKKAFDSLKPKEEKKPEAKEKKEEKKPSAKEKKQPKAATKKISPLTSDEDAAKFEGFKKELSKLLKGHDVKFNFIANGGLSVRIVGKNGSKVFLSYDTPKYDKENNIIASVFIPTKDEELLSELFGPDVEIKKAWNGALHVTNMSFADVIEAFTTNNDILLKLVNTIVKKDEKLGKNREKMESDLKQEKKKKVEEIKKSKEKAAPEKEEKNSSKDDKKKDKKKKK